MVEEGVNIKNNYHLNRSVPMSRRRRNKTTSVGCSESSDGLNAKVDILIDHLHERAHPSADANHDYDGEWSAMMNRAHAAYVAKICIEGAIDLGSKTKMALRPRPRGSTDGEGEEEHDDFSSGDEESVGDEVGGNLKLASSISEGVLDRDSMKLAFGRRKILFFDQVTAQDREAARSFLRNEKGKWKKKEKEALGRHLKREQRKERRKVKMGEDDITGCDGDDSPENCGEMKVTYGTNVSLSAALVLESLSLSRDGSKSGGELKLPFGMSVSLSAALVLESLRLTPLESLEGMAKCYNELVAAGTALLDEAEKSLNPQGNSLSLANDGGVHDRGKILDSLTQLLITTLDQSSGEAILALARLRSMCGTSRYRRRFVQRIAPSLVRPPNSAMWCLRHQNDMPAIITATEFLLDAAPDTFTLGWKQRGSLLLANGHREELLNVAARQLKSLSTSGIQSSIDRKSRPSLSKNASAKGDEKEVLAVDRNIRLSIGNLFTKDWTRVVHIPVMPPEKTIGNQNRNIPHIRTNSTGCPMSPRSFKIPLSPHHTNFMSVPPPPPSSELQQASSSTSSSSSTSPSRSRSPTQGQQPDSLTSSSKSTGNNAVVTAPSTPKQMNTIQTPPRSPSSPPRSKTNPSASTSTPQIPLMPSASPSTSANSTSTSTHSLSSNPSQSSPNYRMLTGSAAERKQTVAACRALRAQIARFEEAFTQLHGRPPKASAERAPLASTYAQYREWKRAIRADAACRIQSFFRGGLHRANLRKDPRFAGFMIRSRRNKLDLLNLSIPVEIGDHVLPKPPTTCSKEDKPGEGVEVVISPKLSPSWHQGKTKKVIELTSAKTTTRHAINSRRDHQNNEQKQSPQLQLAMEQPFDPFQMDPTPASFTSPTNLTTPQGPHQQQRASQRQASRNSPEETLNDFLAVKRNLKNRLKRYDMEFAREHGRMPVKAEKEPIRKLYEEYNVLKGKIHSIEQGAGRGALARGTCGTSSQNDVQTGGGRNSNTKNANNTNKMERSPDLGTSLDSSGDESSGRESHRRRDRKRTGSSKSSTGTASTVGTSSNITQSTQSTTTMEQHAPSSTIGSSPSTSTTTSTTSNAPPSSLNSTINGYRTPPMDLAALRAEKHLLHQGLRTYERQFYQEHRRQVSSFADIQPVASQYRRYKEIKRQIAAFSTQNQR